MPKSRQISGQDHPFTNQTRFHQMFADESGCERVIRNVKLRFSRKLLFVWDCSRPFAGELFTSPKLRGGE